jgi:ribosomal protein S7
MRAAWRAHRARGAPRRLVAPTSRALEAVARATEARKPRKARNAALDVTQAALDLQLRYRPPAEIDRARFGLWARQVAVDAAAGRRAAVSGDVATLEWIRDRFARTLDAVALTRIDTRLERLRADVADGDLAAASRSAAALRKALASST